MYFVREDDEERVFLGDNHRGCPSEIPGLISMVSSASNSSLMSKQVKQSHSRYLASHWPSITRTCARNILKFINSINRIAGLSLDRNFIGGEKHYWIWKIKEARTILTYTNTILANEAWFFARLFFDSVGVFHTQVRARLILTNVSFLTRRLAGGTLIYICRFKNDSYSLPVQRVLTNFVTIGVYKDSSMNLSEVIHGFRYVLWKRNMTLIDRMINRNLGNFSSFTQSWPCFVTIGV